MLIRVAIPVGRDSSRGTGRSQPRRRRAHAVEEDLDALGGAAAAVFLPEPLQEHRAFAVGETGQVGQPLGVLVVLEQLGAARVTERSFNSASKQISRLMLFRFMAHPAGL